MKEQLKVIQGGLRKEERARESFHLLREYINCHEQNVGGNRTAKAILVRSPVGM